MNENIQREEESLIDWFEDRHSEGKFKTENNEFDHSRHHMEEERKFEFLVQDMFLDHFFP